MDLTTCAVCVVAGSAGGVVTGYCAGRRRRRGPRRGAGRVRGTGRAWPGRHRAAGRGEGPGPGGAP